MAIQARIETLEEKHGALEEELNLALNHPSFDDTAISDIKRRKLRLKDEIERLRGEMSESHGTELN